MKLFSQSPWALVVFVLAACPPPPVEICNDGLDNDDNGGADCNDPACNQDLACQPTGQCPVDLNTPLVEGRGDTTEPITPGTEVQGFLCPQFDNDGFRFDVADPGSIIIVTLSMETHLTPIEPGYALFKDEGGGVLTPLGISARDPQKSAGEPVDFTVAHRVEEAGTYVVVVEDVEGLQDRFDNTNPYTLLIDIVPDPDVNEPNNSPPEGTAIAPGTTTGIIATSGDEDWFRIADPGPGRIIDVTIVVGDQSGVEHVATLFAPDGITELQTALLSPGATPGVLEARLRKSTTSDVDGADFFLRIADTGDDGDLDSQLDPALGQYTVTLAILADPDPQELGNANESLATATQVASGTTLNAALAAVADNDVYRIVPPAGTSTANPRVLIVTISFDDAIFDPGFDPQVLVVAQDPESAPDNCNPSAPNPSCPMCAPEAICLENRLQRFIRRSPFVTAFPLRDTRAHYVTINDFADDAFQHPGTYTIGFEIVDDPDPVADDVLVPNLEEAGYENDSDLRAQRNRSLPRATNVATGFLAACDPAAPQAEGCYDLVSVGNPVGFDFPGEVVDCNDPTDAVPSVSRTLTGRLTYEGDRDFFHLAGIPTPGYFAIQVNYTLSTASPIELAIFVHTGNGLGASTLRATQTGSCSEFEGGQNACDDGSICVDERCWTDGQNNAGGSFTFGPNTPTDECVIAGPRNEPPIYIEVVDNGINDFDHDMVYTLNVNITCGCPSACDNNQDYCQNGL